MSPRELMKIHWSRAGTKTLLVLSDTSWPEMTQAVGICGTPGLEHTGQHACLWHRFSLLYPKVCHRLPCS